MAGICVGCAGQQSSRPRPESLKAITGIYKSGLENLKKTLEK